CRLTHPSPTNGRLVGDHYHGERGRCEQRQCLEGAGQEVELRQRFDVIITVLVNHPVAVEKDCLHQAFPPLGPLATDNAGTDSRISRDTIQMRCCRIICTFSIWSMCSDGTTTHRSQRALSFPP